MQKSSNQPLALILSFLLVFSAILPLSAATVTSDYESHWASGIDGNISRQEAAVVLSRISNLTPSSTTLPHTDAAEAASWSKQAIVAASEAKIMVGYPEGDFKPEAAIKRAEV